MRPLSARRASIMQGAIESSLETLYRSAPVVPLRLRDRLVIFSDLHMGDGGPGDDFRSNADLMHAVLRQHYLTRGYSLVLNGDIEELQRTTLSRVRARWGSMYELFDAFRAAAGLYKIVGNHDAALQFDPVGSRDLLQAVRLDFKGETLFLFHGHQATIFFERFNWMAALFIRYGATTLRISNYPVKYESRKRFLTEHRVYDFSARRRILSIIGHTHRPLFESLSKIDALKFRIEQLCREYPLASRLARTAIESAIAECKATLVHLQDKQRRDGTRDSLYNDAVCVPCLFNSGCAIGKRGVTAIELHEERISLVHWFDQTRSGGRTPDVSHERAWRLDGTPFHRVVLKQDHLSYLFSRVKLLA